MSVAIETKKPLSMSEIMTTMKIGMYLSGAVEAMGPARSGKEAAKLMDDYMSKKEMDVPSKSAARTLLTKMEKDNNQKIADTPAKTKLKYMY